MGKHEAWQSSSTMGITTKGANMHIQLGQRGRDVVTGFEGLATGRAEYITGCAQVSLQPSIKEDGSFVEPRWFDETRIEVTDASVADIVAVKGDNGPGEPAPLK